MTVKLLRMRNTLLYLMNLSSYCVVFHTLGRICIKLPLTKSHEPLYSLQNTRQNIMLLANTENELAQQIEFNSISVVWIVVHDTLLQEKRSGVCYLRYSKNKVPIRLVVCSHYRLV